MVAACVETSMAAYSAKMQPRALQATGQATRAAAVHSQHQYKLFPHRHGSLHYAVSAAGVAPFYGFVLAIERAAVDAGAKPLLQVVAINRCLQPSA